jgi:hypothetical protein
MTKKLAILSVIVSTLAFLLSAAPASAQSLQPEVIHPEHHDLSPALRDMLGSASELPDRSPIRIIPLPRSPRPSIIGDRPDPVVQVAGGPALEARFILNFDGLSNVDGILPPDTTGIAGATQYVQWVNLSYAVYDKATGKMLAGPFPGTRFWEGFNGTLCQTVNGGNPLIQYDKAAGRWVATQLAFTDDHTSNSYCVAVSTTSDVLGTYNRYEYNFGDRPLRNPKLGVWPDAYYWTCNRAVFATAQSCAMDRSAMLAGADAISICFEREKEWMLLPSDLDGSTPPPAGSPNLQIQLWDSRTLRMFRFHADFAVPTNSRFIGPIPINVASFNTSCAAPCIPQPGTSQMLDGLEDRLMNRLAYRNFGDHDALVASHTVDVDGIAAIRWYEVRDPGGLPNVFQQGTFAPSSVHLWMPSIAMDRGGNIAFGANASNGTNVKPSLALMSRSATDPPGTLRTGRPIVVGAGVQIGSSRWGGQAAMTIDPVDDCTFWFTGEYAKTDGLNWMTRIASFRFLNCR